MHQISRRYGEVWNPRPEIKFEHLDTGGNCTALWAKHGDLEILVTHYNDPIKPIKGDKFRVGLYSENMDECLYERIWPRYDRSKLSSIVDLTINMYRRSGRNGAVGNPKRDAHIHTYRKSLPDIVDALDGYGLVYTEPDLVKEWAMSFSPETKVGSVDDLIDVLVDGDGNGFVISDTDLLREGIQEMLSHVVVSGNPRPGHVSKREFEYCGGCDCYHPSDFHGDCRYDNNRFNYEQIPGGSTIWEYDDKGEWFQYKKEKWEEVSSNPMKLMTKEIERKARAQYANGSELEGQMIVAKFFDPQGSWTWYLMNQDPNDPDYLWGIVSGNEIEIGSFSLSELSSVRGRFGLGIERDLYFHPLPAKEVWDRLNAGEHI